MRISVKGRYALAAVIDMARDFGSGKNVTVTHIADKLGFSKIYLEQVFSQLKKEGLVLAMKGSRGGYQLSREPGKITVWEVLSALEPAMLEAVEATVEDHAPDIEAIMQTVVFQPLNDTLKRFLSDLTIAQLLEQAEKQKTEQAFMINL